MNRLRLHYVFQCLKMTMEERQFTKTSDASSSIAPDGNRRISGMLRAAAEGEGGGKRKKKREAKECRRKSKKAKTVS